MELLSLFAATSKVDAVTFVLGAIIILGGALGVVLARNPVHAALLLVQTLFGVAVLFVAQGAHFLAAVQVIVYAGAIVVLFLFVIMLLGVDKEEMLEAEKLRNQTPIAVIIVAITAAELLLLGNRGGWATGAKSVVGKLEGPAGNVEQLAEVIFTRYLFAFEATSVLLIIAVVAAVALSRRPEGTDVDADYIETLEAVEAAEAEAAEAEANRSAEPTPEVSDGPTSSDESASEEVSS